MFRKGKTVSSGLLKSVHSHGVGAAPWHLAYSRDLQACLFNRDDLIRPNLRPRTLLIKAEHITYTAAPRRLSKTLVTYMCM